jgi:hypothetical protein
MSDTPVQDWLRPRLVELIRQAEQAGFQRDVVVQVLIDLMTTPPIDEVAAPDGIAR